MMMVNVFIFFPTIILTCILEVSIFCWYNTIIKTKMVYKDYFDSLLDWINNSKMRFNLKINLKKLIHLS